MFILNKSFHCKWIVLGAVTLAESVKCKTALFWQLPVRWLLKTSRHIRNRCQLINIFGFHYMRQCKHCRFLFWGFSHNPVYMDLAVNLLVSAVCFSLVEIALMLSPFREIVWRQGYIYKKITVLIHELTFTVFTIQLLHFHFLLL